MNSTEEGKRLRAYPLAEEEQEEKRIRTKEGEEVANVKNKHISQNALCTCSNLLLQAT
jgi:hypothetical protein